MSGSRAGVGVGVVAGSGRRPLRAAPGPRRVVPGVLLAVTAGLAVLARWPLVGLLATTALLLATPWARTLAARVMVCLVGTLALAAVAVRLTGLTWSTGALVGLVVAILFGHLLVALRVRPDCPIRPAVDLPDAVALGGGATLVVMLGLPYLGRSTDDVLLDLSRGFDAVNHVAGVADLVSQQGSGWTAPGWPSPDGSLPVMAAYPLGFHALLAAALGLAGHDTSRDVVAGFAWLAVLALGACAGVLGWLAVRVAAAVGEPAAARARGLWAGVGYTLCVALSGAFVAPFELGHAPFLVAATVGVAASWLVLVHDPRTPAWASPALLVAAGVGLLGAYPPLAIGLAPAAFTWALRVGRGRRLVWLAPAGVVAVGLLVLWAWRGSVGHLVLSEGENSTPFAVSVILVTLTAAGAWVARDQGWGKAPLCALGPVLGYLVAGVTLATAAGLAGLYPAESYYGTKLAEAAWLAALPVACALVAAGSVAVSGRAGHLGRLAIRLGGALALAVLLGTLPVGRSDGLLAGPSVLAQRMLEAERAAGQVRLTEAARLAGPATGDASAMIEPPGWFYRVAHEDAQGADWTREAVSAALWLSGLRGVRTQEADLVTRCFTGRGDASALPCVQAWLDAKPGRRITFVVGTGPQAGEVADWAATRPAQVRLVVLP